MIRLIDDGRLPIMEFDQKFRIEVGHIVTIAWNEKPAAA